MTTQQHPTQVLEIRNQGLAVFTAIQLDQIPDIRFNSSGNTVVFAFATDLTYEQLNLQWKNSKLHRAHELSISLSGVRKTLLNNRT